MRSAISFYYKNVTSEVIGPDHGISRSQFDTLAAQLRPVIARHNKARAAGQVAYRDLPFNNEISARVKKVAASIAGCENFVVLGIGGSALGNISLQTALNPYMYNLAEQQRKGPRMFVFDNVDPAQLKSFLE